MTTAEWNLVLNGLILLLMAGYGFWLKHIATQQDKLKSNTVEALGAVIASKDAEIARLKGESAPELAKSYKTMKEHSEEMSRQANDLERRLDQARSELGEMGTKLSDRMIIGMAAGLAEASRRSVALLFSIVEKGITERLEPVAILRDVYQLTQKLAEESDARVRRVEGAPGANR